MRQSKKQPAKKRAYVKKAAKWTSEDHKKAIQNIDLLLTPPLNAPKPGPDNELKELLQVISIFDNWNSDQRSRNLKYIVSRYYDFM